MNHRTPTMTNLLNLTHTTRRCSRDTATLEAWITCASTPRAASQRASQKPSRPGLQGNRGPRDRAAGPDRLILPAMQQTTVPGSATASCAADGHCRGPCQDNWMTGEDVRVA
jgi:hypothetical protein